MTFSPPQGFHYLPGYLHPQQQSRLLSELRQILKTMPAYQPTMPRSGKPLSVPMFSLGSWGWYSDRTGGYRYLTEHPTTGQTWPPIPTSLLEIWRRESGYPDLPDTCLVNHYAHEKARMGLHQDCDEETFEAPILSLSLGAQAVFRIGGPDRKDPTGSLKLSSGDLVLLSGPARLAFHGIDRVLIGSSRLLPDGGRINLTLRRVKA